MDPAVLNKMLEGRVKDLASQKRGTSREDLDSRLACLLRSLGIQPLPPRTNLRATVTGVVSRDGYRIEKLRYESRPGLLVTAHLYLPEGTGPWPLVVSAHGMWKGKKAAPVVQARGISFALRGLATLIVDAPGNFGEDLTVDERGRVGAPGDPALLMGAPWIGQYAWDLMRGVESCLGRPDLDPNRIGITGEGDGGVAALAAFVAEPRFTCAVLACSAPSMEQRSLESIAQLGVPGFALAGDFSDMAAIRSPAPVLLMSASDDDRFAPDDVQRTYDKLSRVTKRARLERFEGAHDYNRRMREAALAFFAEHLQGQSPRSYLPELRPLTDGAQNPYPAGTVPQEDPDLAVTAIADRSTIDFREVLRRNLAEPYPEPMHPGERLVPWLKHGTLAKIPVAVTLGLHDAGSVTSPRVTPSIGLNYEQIDMRLAAMVGLSVPEFFSQILHLCLPGKPQAWEPEAVAGGESLSAMIASVKTLVQSATSETIPERIVADGPIASLTAMFLKLYRPSMQIDVTHTWKSWDDLAQTTIAQLIQPQARYLAWPF